MDLNLTKQVNWKVKVKVTRSNNIPQDVPIISEMLEYAPAKEAEEYGIDVFKEYLV